MTTYAGACNARMIEMRNRPFACRVARIALFLGHDMVAGFSGAAHPIVTRCAVGRCALENSSLVAGITGDLHMCAGERKAGRKVIELGFS